jgi:hypothetical protein
MVAVLLLGWLEDLAIGRSPRLNPFATRQDRPQEHQRRRSALLAWPPMVAGAVVAILITALLLVADPHRVPCNARSWQDHDHLPFQEF